MPAAKKKSAPASAGKRAAPVRKPAPRKAAAAPRAVAAAAAPRAMSSAPAAAASATDKVDKAAKADKPRKVKLLRDSFKIPKTEYAVLEALKQRAQSAGRPARKSELLRAGVKALSVMGDAEFMAALGAVPTLKTGRPAGS